ncbi:MAG: IclR family transcriptional regulator [Deltaproteobacteria bacterium]|nr:IclR family transcriptional regulator [Deltaproteobacteria bacterium]
MVTKYKAPTVKKAFQILRLISRADHGVRISNLSKNLGLSKSTVHGITAALEEQGAIIRDLRTKRYTLGLTLFELGRAAYSRVDLNDLARPIMEDLMEKAEESVFLGVKNGNRVTVIDIVESMHDLKITSPIGTSLPLLAGATGKVFLSSMEEKEVKRLLSSKQLPGYTENTITDLELYLAEIRTACEKGYATDDEEYISGVRALAAPVREINHLMLAIWVVGFKSSMDKAKMSAIAKEIKHAAEEIGRRVRKRYKE